MSTENTQTAEPTAGISAESTSATTMGETSSTPDNAIANAGVEGLKRMAKESAAIGYAEKGAKETAETAKPVIPSWQSSYKYKAALQEKEVDEFWRPLIKDQDSEKKVIEALQRLDGFDSVKSSREKLNQEYQSLQNDFHAQSQVVQRVEGALQKGDLGSAFRQLGIKDEDIFRFTQQKLQMMEMPPEQRKAFEDAETLREQQYHMQEQMSQYQKLYEDQAVQARTVQLDLVLSRPEVVSASQSWDNLMGNMGAFRDLVVQEAQNAYYQSGRDLSAEQAVQQVMQKFGKVMQQQSQAMGQPVMPQAHAQAPQMQMHNQQAKPVIPNISGKGAAPIKKVPKNLDDLKRMAKEMQSENN